MMLLEQTDTSVQSLKSKMIISSKNITKIGAWNVRTLYQSGLFAQIVWTFDNYQLDIVSVSEVRWTGSSQTNSDLVRQLTDWTHHWRDRYSPFCSWTSQSNSCASQSNNRQHNAAKDKFYEQLQNTFDNVPNLDLKILIGDFKAQLTRNQKCARSPCFFQSFQWQLWIASFILWTQWAMCHKYILPTSVNPQGDTVVISWENPQ